MKVLLTGATGLIGRSLCRELLRLGHPLVVLGRSTEPAFRRRFSFPCEYYQWADNENTLPPQDAFRDVGAVIHLAGDSIAGARWTEERKKSIRNSRVLGTRNLIEGILKLETRPERIFSASAVGFYGDRGTEELTESSRAGSGFLAEVCVDWENELERARASGIPTIALRTGIVLDHHSKLVEQLHAVFRNYGGGKLGSGEQMMSWIHLKDWIGAILYLLRKPPQSGAVNFVAPRPVSNSEFTRAFASALKVPAFFTVPRFALKVTLGEMSALALEGQSVIPRTLIDLGFQFQYPNIRTALTDLFSWKTRLSENLMLQEQWVPRPLEEVFPFFIDEKNLEALTPKWLNFKVEGKSTESLDSGSLIHYKLNIHGLPMCWTSRISRWDPPYEFADEQIRGPYRKWFHVHGFEPLAGGTLLSDRVVYDLPVWRLGDWFAGAFVARDVKKIFQFRSEQIKTIFS